MLFFGIIMVIAALVIGVHGIGTKNGFSSTCELILAIVMMLVGVSAIQNRNVNEASPNQIYQQVITTNISYTTNFVAVELPKK